MDPVMSWRAPVRRYPVLAIRDFRILLVDRLLAPFSNGFSMVGVSFAVLNVTGSTADLSYVLAAQVAPMLVFTLVSGVFADRLRPQWVIIAGNLAIIVGEGAFGVLMLTSGHPALWAMICLEALNGVGGALFYPASQALLPQIVPDPLLQEGSSISRLAMNTGQMTGAAAAGLVVAAFGPGWALTLCAIGMTGTIPLLLSLKGGRDLRLARGTGMVRSCARDGPSSAAIPGLLSLRYTPRKPMLFVVGSGAAIAITPLSQSMLKSHR
jgi:MFS family permease